MMGSLLWGEFGSMMQVDIVGAVVDRELEEFVGFALLVGDCA